jgi:hypothetical protein
MESVASSRLQKLDHTAYNSMTASTSLRDVARTSIVQLLKACGANSFLQSALGMGMSKVIADVLEILFQESDFSRAVDSWQSSEGYLTTCAKSL